MTTNKTIAARIRLEKRIVNLTIDALLSAGYSVSVDNGGGDEEPSEQYRFLPNMIKKATMQTDMDRLCVYASGEMVGWVLFVYGNDGWDVMSDYTTNLEKTLEPVNAFADANAN